MNRGLLEEKRASIKDAFDHQAKVKIEAENEQLRLQGAYRVLNELIAEQDVIDSKAKEAKELANAKPREARQKKVNKSEKGKK